ncbi:hypothetical protein CC1G_04864 [Coprinopsis cinerea okayama7|uniref:Uncharacterized protein n=1 Tax=Coprinopsis cinerea (strain Okayama-7 / 130 / ATCC MYA-4618 / FGSC 9003) TaxID=240176 RepID=A8PFV0_COPC7|nr:hypothetical protein CC1G_04864 [Coprinopsis cinerea okayama7\|eukprot:XP_001841020.2 hypothetical protein CC1G_04864 [Coprinopsis cinerea okayama7\
MDSSDPGYELAIDYAEVYTTPSLGGGYPDGSPVIVSAPATTVTVTHEVYGSTASVRLVSKILV